MAIEDPTLAVTSGYGQSKDSDTSVPTSGIPTSLTSNKSIAKGSYVSVDSEVQSRPGPTVHGKPTTITLYTSRDLESTGLIPGLHDLINDAFGASHNRSGIMATGSQRLKSHQQLVNELSAVPGMFSYVITYAGTNTVIGVASAKRYKGSPSRQPVRIEEPKTAFTRSGALKPNTEGWELSSMAVDPTLQRQGLAGLLMGLVENEVKRRFLIARAERGDPNVELVMLLTTVKEINWDFYVRRRYEADYETFHEPGWEGSEKGFTVVHMSKSVEL